jgi:hypothetical protein
MFKNSKIAQTIHLETFQAHYRITVYILFKVLGERVGGTASFFPPKGGGGDG